jgi:hypothetical protein
LENKEENEAQPAANNPEQSRLVATVRVTDERYVARREGEVEFLRGQIGTKDAQIKEMTERSRETNVLIGGLQRMLAPLLVSPNHKEPIDQEKSADEARS